MSHRSIVCVEGSTESRRDTRKRFLRMNLEEGERAAKKMPKSRVRRPGL
jgi:hypothetical protein